MHGTDYTKEELRKLEWLKGNRNLVWIKLDKRGDWIGFECYKKDKTTAGPQR